MSVTLTTSLNRSAIPEGEPAALYLLVQLTAAAQAPEDRPALNLAAVMDRSGSMAGPKLAYTKQALRFLVDQTAASDYLSVITFDDQVEAIFPADHVVQKDALKARIDQIDDGGSTNLSGGLIEGYRQVKRHLAKGQINRVLLMTDGQANVGVTSPEALVKKAAELNERGMQLSTLGVGADFNEDLLTAMAGAGGGNFYFIENPDQIPALFARELHGLLSTVAQGLHLRFEAAPGVTVQGVIGYPPAGTPGAVDLTLPDIYAGETKSLVLQLHVEAAFAGDRWLGRLSLDYTAADGSEQSATQDPAIQVTGDSLLLGGPDDAEVLRQVHLARSAEALDLAVTEADRLNFSEGSVILRERIAPMLDLAEETGDEELRRVARELQARAEDLDRRTYGPLERKQMRAQSYQTRSGRRQE